MSSSPQQQTALARAEQGSVPEQQALSHFMPAMTIQQAVERYNTLVEFVQKVMKPDHDYGKIPGTDKNTLLKPGAEKLCTLFGLSAHFALIERTEDWAGDAHGGEPFFYYVYRCGLYRGDWLIAEGDGSCNSRESKYRYRQGERKCPSCGKAAIIRGKEEYGGGWLCFQRKGGCGQKFLAGDLSIESQQVGRVFNPDIADQVNTMQKMAQKRALIAATLLAVNASEFFTQDVEDMVIEGEIVPPAQPRPPARAANGQTNQRAPAPRQAAPQPALSPDEEHAQLAAQIVEAYNQTGTDIPLVDFLDAKYQVEDLDGISIPMKRGLVGLLQGPNARDLIERAVRGGR